MGWKFSCRNAHQLLSERMDRPLGGFERLRLRLHLAICVACSRVEAQMNLIRHAMRRLGNQPK